ncbi:hypothetical protein [Micromonospora sp. DT233]|uniref:hypothetical protein n=1 Tax=Micromonospora sp. DT233 TaxID=3393432 RepID=UPI003CFB420F
MSVGLAAALTACTPAPAPAPGDSTATPTTSTSTSAGGSSGAPEPTSSRSKNDPPPDGSAPSPILRGERQVVLRPVEAFESILAVDAKGRLNLTDGESDKSLFVLAPAKGNMHQIRTAKPQGGGEPDCMGLRDDDAPATVVAAPCDAGRAGQLFTIERTSEESEGRPTYTIRGAGKRYLRALDQHGLIAERMGEGDAGKGVAFDFVDNGAAPVGSGD